MLRALYLPFLIIVFGFSSIAHATIWRVDNNAGSRADFTSLQEAHDGVTDGDTLYVQGSGVSYGTLNLTKTLTIFGPGYFLNENPQTQARPVTAQVSAITFEANSDSSSIFGLEVNGIVTINASNIIVARNKIIANTNQRALGTGSGVADIFIKQNYIVNASASTNADCIIIGSGNANIFFVNNFLATSRIDARVLSSPSSSHLEVHQNILNGVIDIQGSILTNNILRSGSFTFADNLVKNNLSNADQFGNADGNQSNVDMNTVFTGTGSTDGQWQLAATSPALNAGANGEDLGMYGGLEPYVLSGLPAVPAIYFFSGPTAGSSVSGLPIQIKVKSHK